MIIILDDQPYFIEAYTDAMELEGFKVLLTQRVDDFFSAIETTPPEAVIIDIMLPSSEVDAGYNAGVEVYLRFRRSFPDVPAILLTNRDDLNADTVIDKRSCILCKRDITPVALIKIINSMIDDRKHSDQTHE